MLKTLNMHSSTENAGGLKSKTTNATKATNAMIAFHALPLLEAEAKERQRAAGGDRKSEEYQESVQQIIAKPITPK